MVTGRSKHARACMAALRAQARRIQAKRRAAVVEFEKGEEDHHKALKMALKQKEHYKGWCQKNAAVSQMAFLQRFDAQKLVHE